MTDPRDPTRLRDLDPILRQAFDLARNDQPSTATVEAMIRSVEQATLGPAVHGEPLSTAAPKLALLKSQAAKLLVIAGVSSGVLWTLPSLQAPATDQAPPAPAVVASDRSTIPSTREHPQSDDPRTSREPFEPLTPSTRRSSSGRSTSEATHEHARKVTRARRRDARRSVAVVNLPVQSVATPADDPGARGPVQESDRSQRASEQRAAERRPSIDELTLLEEAQRALRNSPERVLALTEQHEREYPNGTYVQEREQIAIEALFNAGRSAEMRARAERFREAFPRSAHNARITELLELQP